MSAARYKKNNKKKHFPDRSTVETEWIPPLIVDFPLINRFDWMVACHISFSPLKQAVCKVRQLRCSSSSYFWNTACLEPVDVPVTTLLGAVCFGLRAFGWADASPQGFDWLTWRNKATWKCEAQTRTRGKRLSAEHRSTICGQLRLGRQQRAPSQSACSSVRNLMMKNDRRPVEVSHVKTVYWKSTINESHSNVNLHQMLPQWHCPLVVTELFCWLFEVVLATVALLTYRQRHQFVSDY